MDSEERDAVRVLMEGCGILLGGVFAGTALVARLGWGTRDLLALDTASEQAIRTITRKVVLRSFAFGSGLLLVSGLAASAHVAFKLQLRSVHPCNSRN